MRIGDKVILKSGGPIMTVTHVEQEDRGHPDHPDARILGDTAADRARRAAAFEITRKIAVAWFTEEKHAHFSDFPAGALESGEEKPQDWSRVS